MALSVFYIGYFLLVWVRLRKWKAASQILGERVDPLVSIVVPAFNEEKMIIHKLENLSEQLYPNLEVIVVNDGSTDNTESVVQRFITETSTSFRLRLISFGERQGKSSAINAAWKECRGDVMVISDADTLLEKNAIQKIVQNFRDPQVGGVTGKLSMINYDETSSTNLEKSYRNIFDMLRLGESCIDSTPVFNGPLIAIRRELFEPLKSNTLADDTEIALRIRERGYRAIFDPVAEVYAFTPRSFRFRMKQKIRRAQGIIQALIRHRELLFNKAYGKYGLVVVPCEFFMHVISPMLVLLSVALIVFCLILYSVPLLPILILMGLATVILGLAPVITKFLSKGQSRVNPLRFLATFMEHELFLGIGLFSLILKRNDAKWEKIDD